MGCGVMLLEQSTSEELGLLFWVAAVAEVGIREECVAETGFGITPGLMTPTEERSAKSKVCEEKESMRIYVG